MTVFVHSVGSILVLRWFAAMTAVRAYKLSHTVGHGMVKCCGDVATWTTAVANSCQHCVGDCRMVMHTLDSRW